MSWGVWGHALPDIFLILIPQSPLSWISESVRQDIGQFCSPQMKPYKSAHYFIKVSFHVVADMEQGESKPLSRFQFGKLRLFIIKSLTDFCKTVRTGVDPRLPASSQGRTRTQGLQITSPVLNHLACRLQCLVCFLWFHGFLYTAVP